MTCPSWIACAVKAAWFVVACTIVAIVSWQGGALIDISRASWVRITRCALASVVVDAVQTNSAVQTRIAGTFVDVGFAVLSGPANWALASVCSRVTGADSVVDAWVVRVGAQVDLKIALGASHSWLTLCACGASEVARAITGVGIVEITAISSILAWSACTFVDAESGSIGGVVGETVTEVSAAEAEELTAQLALQDSSWLWIAWRQSELRGTSSPQLVSVVGVVEGHAQAVTKYSWCRSVGDSGSTSNWIVVLVAIVTSNLGLAAGLLQQAQADQEKTSK